MWIDCQDVLVNIDNVDYISFDYENEIPAAFIYFANRASPVVFYAEDLDKLKEFFLQYTVAKS